MIRLILVRHGNTFSANTKAVQIGRQTDLPLTEQGHRQAEFMVGYLQACRISPKSIYAGDLKRQVESANAIAKAFGLEVQREIALTEIDYGSWEGLTAKEIEARWPIEYAQWAEGKWQPTIFGGNLEAHCEAIKNWLDRLRAKKEDCVIAITSGGLLRFFKELIPKNKNSNCPDWLVQNQKVKTGHFCEIEVFEEGLKIQRWNVDPSQDRLSQFPFAQA